MGDVRGTGYDDEKPVRTVEFKKRFAIGKYEVSFAEYDRYLYAQGVKERNFPSDQGWPWERRPWGRERWPIIGVSWKNAAAYARWLSEQTGKRYRLPTEAEWEYAARAGTGSAWFWGNDASQACIYGNVFDRRHETGLKAQGVFGESAECDDDYGETAPVGAFKPNAYGVHDMTGNVWEWVQDCYHENYKGAPRDGSAREDAKDCDRRVIRGGSWTSRPVHLRSAHRESYNPDRISRLIGFRLAQDVD